MKEKILKKFQDRQEADIVKALLESGGIVSRIATDNAGGFYPSMDALSGIVLFVDEDDYEDALLLVESGPFEDTE